MSLGSAARCSTPQTTSPGPPTRRTSCSCTATSSARTARPRSRSCGACATGSEGRLRFAFRHFPLTEIHPDALARRRGGRGRGRPGLVLGDARRAVRERRALRRVRPGRAGGPDRARRGAVPRRAGGRRARRSGAARPRRGARRRRGRRRPRSSSTGGFTARASTPVPWSRHSRRIRQTATNLASRYAPRVCADCRCPRPVRRRLRRLRQRRAEGPGRQRPDRERHPRVGAERRRADRHGLSRRATARRCRSSPTRWPPAPSLALASSVFTTGGDSRMAFGMIAKDGTPVYGPTAVYVAPTPERSGRGPVPRPRRRAADRGALPLQAGGDDRGPVRRRLRRRRASSPSAASTRCSPRPRSPTARSPARPATSRSRPRTPDPIPAVGEKAPVVHTDTLETVKGDVAMLDTREPPSDMHEVDFAEVVGKEPVALLFATPQLCASRVCGPVADIALQMKAKYGDRMKFIHQEVLGRQRHHQGPARAAASSSTCRRSRGCSSSTGPARSPRGSRVRSASRSSRKPSSPGCEARARGTRGGAGRRCAGAGRGVRSRPRPAPAAPDPAVAVRVGRRRGARHLVLRAGAAVAEAEARARQLAAAARRAGARERGGPGAVRRRSASGCSS